tara:strand:+ start:944 stop:1861 length:918 start_codon:yes stop_codon:yes gene_type:complete
MPISGPFSSNYKPKFSGHETFPLRYTWIPKITQKLKGNNSDYKTTSHIFNHDQGIMEFGVGKNMVKSIDYWSQVTGITERNNEGRILTQFGNQVFKIHDPFIENISSIWLLHWKLASRPQLTTWYYVFNYLNSLSFTKEELNHEIIRLTKELIWTNSSENTIKRDIDVFIRSYTLSRDKKNNFNEDSFECPLSELGLIRNSMNKDAFDIHSGAKQSLSPAVVAYAVYEYASLRNESLIPLERLCSDFGSPGKVFRVDENSMIKILSEIDQTSQGMISYSETAGNKQIRVNSMLATPEALLERIYQ